jgi:hypothetical protein
VSLKIDTSGDFGAVYPLHPECPQCSEPLARPHFWGELKPEQRRNTFQVWCPICRHTVAALFLTGRYE